MRFTSLALSLFAFFLPYSHADVLYLPENHAINGGLTIIPIYQKQKPDVYYINKKIAVIAADKPFIWHLIVGIPLNVKSPVQTLTELSPTHSSIPFHISLKQYPTRHLTIKNLRYADPYYEDKLRIEKERATMQKIFSQYRDVVPFHQAFIFPIKGNIVSPFGLNRLYNQKWPQTHLGVDIEALIDSPVHAVADGIVVNIDNYFFTGNTVIVDHGMGVFSLYGHLNKIQVHAGQSIKQGATLGQISDKGSSASHLHWAMIMNQTPINPLLFVLD